MKFWVFCAVTVLSTAAASAEDRFMPTASCTQVSGFDDAAEHQAMERYLHYVVTSKLNKTLPETRETYAELRRRVGAVCVDLPYGSAIELAAVKLAEALANDGASIEEQARAVLRPFLEPGADLKQLTLKFKPTQQEIESIFVPNLVPAVTAYVEKVFGGGSIGAKQGQTDILIVATTTSDLIDRKPVLGDFPGGYKKLLPHLNRDIPIIRFKFVEPGETSGMAFDGLYKVGDRWVMIPKGWRSVPE